MTYDALDQVVEEGSTMQILYGPTGKLGVQSGQTNTRTYLGLPKGAGIIYDGSSVVYQHPDLLGNGILGTNNTRGKVFDRFFAPFGEIYDNSGSETANFTGHFQDLDSNLYDYEFREQSPIQGRWINPDPSGMSSVTFSDPQTLNRYAYVRGSAMGMIDANGLSAWGGALRSFLDGAFLNFTATPGWMDVSNWMGGNLYATFPPFSGTATVYARDLTTPEGDGTTGQQSQNNQPYITPGAISARAAALAILSGENPCSHFFNHFASFYTGGDGDAADILSNVPIELSMTPMSLATVATTVGGSFGSATIVINPEGAFFLQMPGNPEAISPFKQGQGSLQEQILAIFHEFAHDIDAIPEDGQPLLGLGARNNAGQSFANTNIVLMNCYSEINSSAGP